MVVAVRVFIARHWGPTVTNGEASTGVNTSYSATGKQASQRCTPVQFSSCTAPVPPVPLAQVFPGETVRLPAPVRVVQELSGRYKVFPACRSYPLSVMGGESGSTETVSVTKEHSFCLKTDDRLESEAGGLNSATNATDAVQSA